MAISALSPTQAATAAALYATRSGQADKQLEITGNAALSQGSSDRVSLSGQGRLLSQLPPLFSKEIEADGVITLEELDQFHAEKAAALGQELSSRLAALGVDDSEVLELTTDAEGQVRVVGAHADKEKVEAMFAADPELANRLRQVSGLASLIDASKKHVEFAREYAEDPEAAVAAHAELFSSLPGRTTLTLAGGGLTARVS